MQDETIGDWLSSVAAKQPAPGGGAAAALLAATSAALIGMVCAYTTGEKWADREVQMKNLNKEARALRAQALKLASEDAQAFAAVSAAYQMPKDTEEQSIVRTQAIQKASEVAAEPPRKTAELAASLIDIAAGLVESANPNVLSDVAVASSTARSALESAIVNIEVNQKFINNQEAKNSLNSCVDEALNAIKKADDVTNAVRSKLK